MSHFRKSIQATALAASLVIALAPALAAAKAGGGSSAGSRGSRTTQSAPATPTAPQAAPVERSATPPAQPQRPAQQAAPSATPGAPAQQPGFFQRNPFMAGMMGGLLGAGLVGMLFGGGLFGAGGMGAAGVFGLLLQLALIGGLVWLGLRIFRSLRGQPSQMGQPQMATAGGAPTDFRVSDIPPANQPQARVADIAPMSAGLQITEQDFEAFQQALTEIQSAWSKGDLDALRRHATPEMVGYFGRDLSLLASKGLTNHVEAVTLEQGDLAESWSEDGIDYATVAMRWSALDYTLRTDGSVAEGSKTERGMSTEVWTFLRSQDGGRWLLSAIQQPDQQTRH